MGLQSVVVHPMVHAVGWGSGALTWYVGAVVWMSSSLRQYAYSEAACSLVCILIHVDCSALCQTIGPCVGLRFFLYGDTG